MEEIKERMRVRVHVNLRDKSFTVSTYHKGKGWRKACAAQRVLLRDVEFRVSQAGRWRVLQQGRRNVHAYAIGTLVSWTEAGPLLGATPVKYNPYKADTFTTSDSTPVYEAQEVLFSMKYGVQAWGIIAA